MNTSRVPLGERAQREILTHIESVGDEAESNYLELKSQLDVGKKHELAKIAKFLLGAANRTVAEANRNFCGYAVLVLGAAQGRSPGIARGIEAHDLENSLRPYLGPDLPIFDLGRLAVDDQREVLFIFSPPPVDGQPPFPCHKEFRGEKGQEQLDDGAIYVRGRSNTRPARSSEISALITRARGSGKPDIDIRVRVIGNIQHVSRLAETFEVLYQHEEAEYLKVSDNVGGGFETIIGREITRTLNKRERQTAVNEWRKQRTDHIVDGIHHLLGAGLPPLRLAVTSVDRFVAKPHLTITFHGCRFYDHVVQADVKKIIHPVAKVFNFLAPALDVSNYEFIARDRDVSWANEADDAVVRLTPDAFRPNSEWVTDDDDLVLAVTSEDGAAVKVSWTLTEDASDVVSTGRFMVETGVPINASDLFLQVCREV